MTIATKTTVDRELEIAAAFATNLLAAVARALDADPDDVLDATSVKGRGLSAEHCATCSAPDLWAPLVLRDAFVALARRCWPELSTAPRKLAIMCRGELARPPLWSDLAALEVVLGVAYGVTCVAAPAVET